MRALNATDLFDGQHDPGPWPASSESFWTVLFALFVLHLGAGKTPRGQLTVWRCTDGSGKKYYAPRPSGEGRGAVLEFSNLSFDSLAVEPPSRGLSTKPWPGTGRGLPIAAGGFPPDVVIRSHNDGSDHFVVVENKATTGAHLAKNQFENYPLMVQWLIEAKVSFDFLLLQSTGCCEKLTQQARLFQRYPWAEHFGILLWEEVLRVMDRTDFMPGLLPIKAWQKYTASLDAECERPEA
jgi:hypothetical protein